MFNGILFLLAALFSGYCLLHGFQFVTLFLTPLCLWLAYVSFKTSWTLTSIRTGVSDLYHGRRYY